MPRSATAGTTQAKAESNIDEAHFSEQLRRLRQSLEEINASARLNSRGKPRHQLARAAGSGIVRPI